MYVHVRACAELALSQPRLGMCEHACALYMYMYVYVWVYMFV